MVLHNTMGINYNTLATLAGSKPCLFYSFERAFVGYFSGSAVSPIIKKKEPFFPSAIGNGKKEKKRGAND